MTLTEWLAETKTTPATLAAACGVHWATIYKWRKGTAFPRPKQVHALAKATDGKVTVADLAAAFQVAG